MKQKIYFWTVISVSILTILLLSLIVLEEMRQPVQSSFVKIWPLQSPYIKSYGNERVVLSNRTETVSFCGKMYEVQKIAIDNIDVINRIAGLSKEGTYNICKNIQNNAQEKDLTVSIAKQKATDVDYKDGTYFLTISVLRFKIDWSAGDIYLLDAFSGEPLFLGKIK